MTSVNSSRRHSRTLALAAAVALAAWVYSGVHARAEWPRAAAGQGATAGAKKSIWDGVYTEEQAARGQRAYEIECVQCHSDDLQGDGFAPSLVGAPFYLRWNGSTVGDLLLDIKASMPEGAPDSLSLPGYTDVVTYLLKANKLPAGATELPTDVDVLQAIVIRSKPAS